MRIKIANPADRADRQQLAAGDTVLVPAVGDLEEFPVARRQADTETSLVLHDLGLSGPR